MTTSPRRSAALLLIAAALAASPAFAQPPPRDRMEPPRPDQDADGEPRRPREQLFVSPSGQPFRARMDEPYPAARWFAQADADHDGRLTRDEFRADAEAYFKVVDADADRLLSMPEATRWEEELVPETAQPTFGGYGGGRGGPLRRNRIDTRAQGAATYSMINEPHPVRGADADFSMKVSQAEWRAAADRRFGVLDVDGDGSVALIDLPQTPAQRLYAREGGGRGAARRPPPRR